MTIFQFRKGRNSKLTSKNKSPTFIFKNEQTKRDTKFFIRSLGLASSCGAMSYFMVLLSLPTGIGIGSAIALLTGLLGEFVERTPTVEEIEGKRMQKEHENETKLSHKEQIILLNKILEQVNFIVFLIFTFLFAYLLYNISTTLKLLWGAIKLGFIAGSFWFIILIFIWLIEKRKIRYISTF